MNILQFPRWIMLEEAKKEIVFSGVKNEIREQKMKIQVQTIDKNKIE